MDKPSNFTCFLASVFFSLSRQRRLLSSLASDHLCCLLMCFIFSSSLASSRLFSFLWTVRSKDRSSLFLFLFPSLSLFIPLLIPMLFGLLLLQSWQILMMFLTILTNKGKWVTRTHFICRQPDLKQGYVLTQGFFAENILERDSLEDILWVKKQDGGKDSCLDWKKEVNLLLTKSSLCLMMKMTLMQMIRSPGLKSGPVLEKCWLWCRLLSFSATISYISSAHLNLVHSCPEWTASLATEIGFYQGYTTAWLTLLEKQDQVWRDVFTGDGICILSSYIFPNESLNLLMNFKSENLPNRLSSSYFFPSVFLFWFWKITHFLTVFLYSSSLILFIHPL